MSSKKNTALLIILAATLCIACATNASAQQYYYNYQPGYGFWGYVWYYWGAFYNTIFGGGYGYNNFAVNDQYGGMTSQTTWSGQGTIQR